MPKIRVRREKFVQTYCPRDSPMVSAPICIRCLDFFANDFTLAAKFEVVCSLMVNPSICGDICHTDFISAKVGFQIRSLIGQFCGPMGSPTVGVQRLRHLVMINLKTLLRLISRVTLVIQMHSVPDGRT